MVLFSTILPVRKDVLTINIFDMVMSWSSRKDVTEESFSIGETYIWRYTNKKGIPWTETFIYEEKTHLLYITQETDYVTDDIRKLESRYVTPSIISYMIHNNILDGIGRVPVSEISDNPLPKLIINRFRQNERVQTLAYRLKGAAEIVCPSDANDDNYIIFRGQRLKLPAPVGSDEKRLYDHYVHTALDIGRRYLYKPEYSWENLVHLKQIWENLVRLKQMERDETGDQKVIDRMQEEINGLNKKLVEERELIGAYEEEVTMLENKLVAAHNQLSANSVHISGLKKRLDKESEDPVIFYGEESDLYEGEIKDIILSILEKEYKNIPEKTRRRDVLESILKANNISGVGMDILSRVKKALKDYKTLNGSTKLLLESLGFEVENTKEHYKIRFKNDPRYLVVLSKTASDYKQGKNFTSDMSIEMF